MKDNLKEWYRINKKQAPCPVCGKLSYIPRMQAHIDSHYTPESKYQKTGTYICKYCNGHWPSSTSLGGHVVNCDMNPKKHIRNQKISESRKGFHHSKETKEKISKTEKKTMSKIKKLEEEGLKEVSIEKIDIGGDDLELTFFEE
jgi:hypothetical protein